jgi:hypothetical protein
MVAKLGLKIIVVLIAAVLFYALLLRFPHPFFPVSASVGNLTLYSDRPFSPEAGKKVLDLVQGKLAASPLYSADSHYAVFVCNAKWRWMIFSVTNYWAGGLSYYPFTSNIYLSGAMIEENRLISRSGKPDMFGRKLDHFIVHEITHVLTGRAVGWLRFIDLSNWVKEGYAEYVARGSGFNYEEAVRAFLIEAPEMNQPEIAPYLRYNLLVAYLLDKKRWSPPRMLEDAIKQDEVEAILRKEMSPM